MTTTRLNLEGRCLCGDSLYQIDGTLHGIIHCHCRRCRKAHGAGFASFAVFEDARFCWLSDGGAAGRYQSSASTTRGFCRSCGSSLPGQAEADVARVPFRTVPAGNLPELPRAPEVSHVYLGSRLPWSVVPPAAGQFETVPDHWQDPALPELARPTGAAAISGSCLCGAVAFEAGPPVFMMNCHCSRCRLSRAAAHATNVFVPRSSLSWLAGADDVVHYKLPEAERFGCAFCRHCGSLMPRSRSSSELANVPVGCLDTDPGLEPRGHIHVNAKAPWFEIGDSLEQWQTAPVRVQK